MKSYLSLVSAHAKVHKKKNRPTLVCIVIAVMLASAVFGMADMSVRAQINEQIRTGGNFHVALSGLSEKAAKQIGDRSDVRAAGWIEEIETASFRGKMVKVVTAES